MVIMSSHPVCVDETCDGSLKCLRSEHSFCRPTKRAIEAGGVNEFKGKIGHSFTRVKTKLKVGPVWFFVVVYLQDEKT